MDAIFQIDGVTRKIFGVRGAHPHLDWYSVTVDQPSHPGVPCATHSLPGHFIRNAQPGTTVFTGGHRYAWIAEEPVSNSNNK